MPLFKEIIKDKVRIIIWKCDEVSEYDVGLKNRKNRKIKEKQSVKEIIKHFFQKENLLYNDSGEQYLDNFK